MLVVRYVNYPWLGTFAKYLELRNIWHSELVDELTNAAHHNFM